MCFKVNTEKLTLRAQRSHYTWGYQHGAMYLSTPRSITHLTSTKSSTLSYRAMFECSTFSNYVTETEKNPMYKGSKLTPCWPLLTRRRRTVKIAKFTVSLAYIYFVEHCEL